MLPSEAFISTAFGERVQINGYGNEVYRIDLGEGGGGHMQRKLGRWRWGSGATANDGVPCR